MHLKLFVKGVTDQNNTIVIKTIVVNLAEKKLLHYLIPYKEKKKSATLTDFTLIRRVQLCIKPMISVVFVTAK